LQPSTNADRFGLVDNIFIGHDVAAAKEFAKETYHLKKPIEQEAEGSAPEDDDAEAESLIDKARLKVYEFIRESRFEAGFDRVIFHHYDSLEIIH